MRSSQTLKLALLLASLLPLRALTAPTTETPTNLEALPSPAVPMGADATGTTADIARRGTHNSGTHNSDTRTIDLLIELQQPTAGLRFNERPTRGNAGEPSTRILPATAGATTMSQQPAAVDAPPTPPSGLFGAGATPAVQARSGAFSGPPSGSESLGSRASGRPSSELPPELKRWLQGPRQIVDYVRENRGFVAGCAALLLVLGWTGSMLFSRRRA